MSKKLKCLVVDDEPHAIKILEMYIQKTPFLEVGKSTSSPWEALEYLKSGEPDLAFLDIQMEDLTGLQLLDLVENKCPIILTTAYSEYAIKGYEYQVADYLLKPISYDRFVKAASKVLSVSENERPSTRASEVDHIFLKGDAKNKFHRLHFSEINYVEGLRNYVQFNCTDQKVTSLQNMKSLEEQLPRELFIRIHKSYIINVSKIKQVEGNSVLINAQRIPIGQSYRKAFFSKIDQGRKI